MRHLLTIAIACTSGLAAADPSPDVRLVAEPATRTIRAELAHVPRMPARAIALRAGGALAPARSIRQFDAAGEPVAIAIVYSGNELWIGNDQIEEDENARYIGALRGLGDAIDRVDFARVLPAGSTAALVTYADGARVRVPLGPITQLRGAALGTQADYYKKVGTDLVDGVGLALLELAKSSARDKYLVVIGDGVDTDPDSARRQLIALKHRAERDHIELHAIVYRSPTTLDAPLVVASFVPGTRIVHSSDGMHAALLDVVAAIGDRYEVTFDARDLPWDGGFHQAVVWLDREELSGVTIELADMSSAPWWKARWLVELGIGLAFVVVALGVLRVRYTLGG